MATRGLPVIIMIIMMILIVNILITESSDLTNKLVINIMMMLIL